MAKKPPIDEQLLSTTASAPAEPEVAPDEFDIPAVVGGHGRSGNRGDAVTVIGKGTHVAAYPSDQSFAHMKENNWRGTTAAFKANGAGEILQMKLMKAAQGQGSNLRERKNQRPHFHIPLAAVVVTEVEHDGGDAGTCTSRIEADGSVVFELPKIIRGKFAFYKLTRRA